MNELDKLIEAVYKDTGASKSGMSIEQFRQRAISSPENLSSFGDLVLSTYGNGDVDVATKFKSRLNSMYQESYGQAGSGDLRKAGVTPIMDMSQQEAMALTPTKQAPEFNASQEARIQAENERNGIQSINNQPSLMEGGGQLPLKSTEWENKAPEGFTEATGINAASFQAAAPVNQSEDSQVAMKAISAYPAKSGDSYIPLRVGPGSGQVGKKINISPEAMEKYGEYYSERYLSGKQLTDLSQEEIAEIGSNMLKSFMGEEDYQRFLKDNRLEDRDPTWIDHASIAWRGVDRSVTDMVFGAFNVGSMVAIKGAEIATNTVAPIINHAFIWDADSQIKPVDYGDKILYSMNMIQETKDALTQGGKTGIITSTMFSPVLTPNGMILYPSVGAALPESGSGQVAEAIGSAVPFVVGGLASRGSKVITATMGATMNAQGQLEGLIDEKGDAVTASDVVGSLSLGALVGTTESFGVGSLASKFKSIPKALRPTKAIMEKIGLGVAEEAGQEGFTQWANNVSDKLVYDKSRDLLDGVAENATVGGAVGLIFSGLAGAVSYRSTKNRYKSMRAVADQFAAAHIISNYIDGELVDSGAKVDGKTFAEVESGAYFYVYQNGKNEEHRPGILKNNNGKVTFQSGPVEIELRPEEMASGSLIPIDMGAMSQNMRFTDTNKVQMLNSSGKVEKQYQVVGRKRLADGSISGYTMQEVLPDGKLGPQFIQEAEPMVNALNGSFSHFQTHQADLKSRADQLAREQAAAAPTPTESTPEVAPVESPLLETPTPPTFQAPATEAQPADGSPAPIVTEPGESQAETNKTGLVLFHGSPHKVDKFSTGKIGTGEGVQAFGWGLYFTNMLEIAKGYANKLSTKKNFWEALKNGHELSFSREDFDFIKTELGSLGFDGESAENAGLGSVLVNGETENAPDVLDAMAVLFSKDAKKELKGFDLSEIEINRLLEIKKKISDPQVYKVALHEGKSPSEYDYIEWDGKLTDSQREKIGRDFPEGISGQEAYKALSKELGGDQKASEYLLSKGIDGVVYKSEKGTGGRTGEGRNYVIFDDSSIRVDEINDQKQPAAESTPAPASKEVLADLKTAYNAAKGKVLSAQKLLGKAQKAIKGVDAPTKEQLDVVKLAQESLDEATAARDKAKTAFEDAKNWVVQAPAITAEATPAPAAEPDAPVDTAQAQAVEQNPVAPADAVDQSNPSEPDASPSPEPEVPSPTADAPSIGNPFVNLLDSILPVQFKNAIRTLSNIVSIVNDPNVSPEEKMRVLDQAGKAYNGLIAERDELTKKKRRSKEENERLRKIKDAMASTEIIDFMDYAKTLPQVVQAALDSKKVGAEGRAPVLQKIAGLLNQDSEGIADAMSYFDDKTADVGRAGLAKEILKTVDAVKRYIYRTLKTATRLDVAAFVDPESAAIGATGFEFVGSHSGLLNAYLNLTDRIWNVLSEDGAISDADLITLGYNPSEFSGGKEGALRALQMDITSTMIFNKAHREMGIKGEVSFDPDEDTTTEASNRIDAGYNIEGGILNHLDTEALETKSYNLNKREKLPEVNLMDPAANPASYDSIGAKGVAAILPGIPIAPRTGPYKYFDLSPGRVIPATRELIARIAFELNTPIRFKRMFGKRGDFDVRRNTITLLGDTDFGPFIHELGHKVDMGVIPGGSLVLKLLADPVAEKELLEFTKKYHGTNPNQFKTPEAKIREYREGFAHFFYTYLANTDYARALAPATSAALDAELANNPAYEKVVDVAKEAMSITFNNERGENVAANIESRIRFMQDQASITLTTKFLATIDRLSAFSKIALKGAETFLTQKAALTIEAYERALQENGLVPKPGSDFRTVMPLFNGMEYSFIEQITKFGLTDAAGNLVVDADATFVVADASGNPVHLGKGKKSRTRITLHYLYAPFKDGNIKTQTMLEDYAQRIMLLQKAIEIFNVIERNKVDAEAEIEGMFTDGKISATEKASRLMEIEKQYKIDLQKHAINVDSGNNINNKNERERAQYLLDNIYKELDAEYAKDNPGLDPLTNHTYRDRIDEGIRRYRKFAQANLQLMVDSGRMSREVFDKINRDNQFYAAMNRVVDERMRQLNGDGSLSAIDDDSSLFSFRSDYYAKGVTTRTGLAAAGNPVKRRGFSTRMIQDPYLSLFQSSLAIRKEVARNNLAKMFVDALKGTDMIEDVTSSFGMYGKGDIRRDPVIQVFEGKSIKTYNVGVDQARFLKQMYGATLTDSPVAKFISDVFGASAKITRWTVTRGLPFIWRNFTRDTMSRLAISKHVNAAKFWEEYKSYFNDGKVTLGYFGNPEAESVDEMYSNAVDPTTEVGIMQTTGLPRADVKALILEMAYQFNKNGEDTDPDSYALPEQKAAASINRRMREVSTVSTGQALALYGGKMSFSDIRNVKDYYSLAAKALNEDGDSVPITAYGKAMHYLKRSGKTLAAGWGAYEKVIETGEQANRNAEFRAALKWAKENKPSWTEQDRLKYAAAASRGLMDFSVGGEAVLFANKYIPFLNPAIQSLRIYARAIAADAKGTGKSYALSLAASFAKGVMIRSLVFQGLLSVIEGVANYINDPEELYLSEAGYMKDLFWVIRVPGNGGKIVIPKPYETAAFVNIMSRMIKSGIYRDGKYMDGREISKYMKDLFLPIKMDEVAGSFAFGSISLAMNQDFHLDTKIVPEKETGMLVANRSRERTSALGLVLQDATVAFNKAIPIMDKGGIDGRYFDFLIKKNFSYFGSLALKTYNSLSEAFGDKSSASSSKVDFTDPSVWTAKLYQKDNIWSNTDVEHIEDFIIKHGGTAANGLTQSMALDNARKMEKWDKEGRGSPMPRLIKPLKEIKEDRMSYLYTEDPEKKRRLFINFTLDARALREFIDENERDVIDDLGVSLGTSRERKAKKVEAKKTELNRP